MLSGISMYTSLKVRAIGSGKEFLLDVGSALTGVDRDQVIDSLPKFPPLPPPRPPHMQDLSPVTTTANTSLPEDDFSQKNITELLDMLTPEIKQLLYSDFESPWFPVPMAEGEVAFSVSGRRKRSPVVRREKRFPGMMTLARFVMKQESLKPRFGYAFYLCWVGMATIFVALACGTYYRIRQGYVARMALSNV